MMINETGGVQYTTKQMIGLEQLSFGNRGDMFACTIKCLSCGTRWEHIGTIYSTLICPRCKGSVWKLIRSEV